MARQPQVHELATQLDAPRAHTGIGVVAPFDFALDHELWQLVPDNVTLHLTRTPYVNLAVGVDQAAKLSDAAAVGEACRTLSVVWPASTVYLCTSGSFVDGLNGEAKLRATMESAGAVRAITTSSALLEALDALGVRRVGVGTPYDQELTARLNDLLAEAGVEVTRSACLGLTGNIPQVSAGTVRELAEAVAEHADAVFLSCTNLPTVDLVTELERDLGMPVLSANLVTMWSALRSIQASTQARPERLFYQTELA